MSKSIQTDVSTLAADFGANWAIPPKTKGPLSWASFSRQTLSRVSNSGDLRHSLIKPDFL